MVRLIKEGHSIYDAFGVVIDDGKEAWVLYCDSEYYAKYVKKYLDEHMDDITYTLKTAHEVADYIQGRLLNAVYLDMNYVPEDIEEPYSDTLKIGPVLIDIKEWYDI